jgi:hypothetical protein
MALGTELLRIVEILRSTAADAGTGTDELSSFVARTGKQIVQVKEHIRDASAVTTVPSDEGIAGVESFSQVWKRVKSQLITSELYRDHLTLVAMRAVIEDFNKALGYGGEEEKLTKEDEHAVEIEDLGTKQKELSEVMANIEKLTEAMNLGEKQ